MSSSNKDTNLLTEAYYAIQERVPVPAPRPGVRPAPGTGRPKPTIGQAAASVIKAPVKALDRGVKQLRSPTYTGTAQPRGPAPHAAPQFKYNKNAPTAADTVPAPKPFVNPSRPAGSEITRPTDRQVRRTAKRSPDIDHKRAVQDHRAAVPVKGYGPNAIDPNAPKGPKPGEAELQGGRLTPPNAPGATKPTLGGAVRKGAEWLGRGIGTVASLPFKAVGGLATGIGQGLKGDKNTQGAQGQQGKGFQSGAVKNTPIAGGILSPSGKAGEIEKGLRNAINPEEPAKAGTLPTGTAKPPAKAGEEVYPLGHPQEGEPIFPDVEPDTDQADTDAALDEWDFDERMAKYDRRQQRKLNKAAAAADKEEAPGWDTPEARGETQGEPVTVTGGPLSDEDKEFEQHAADIDAMVASGDITKEKGDELLNQWLKDRSSVAVKESIQVPQYVSNARLASIRNKARLKHPLTLTEQKILDNNQGIRI